MGFFMLLSTIERYEPGGNQSRFAPFDFFALVVVPEAILEAANCKRERRSFYLLTVLKYLFTER